MDPHRCAIELAATPAQVWVALTEPQALSRWFGAHVRIDAREGGKAEFTFDDGRLHTATIEVFLPPGLLLLRWLPLYKDATGATRQAPGGHLRFVVKPSGRTTVLEIEDSVGLGPARSVMLRVAG